MGYKYIYLRLIILLNSIHLLTVKSFQVFRYNTNNDEYK